MENPCPTPLEILEAELIKYSFKTFVAHMRNCVA